MIVLPTIEHALRSLQPRTATGKDLSGGAITGIVIGCIVGVLLLLAIFWTCLLGSHIVTKAKNVSNSVVDKAEKGHARAKDLYTAGRERGRQPLHLQDEVHYGDTDSDLSAEGDHGILYALPLSAQLPNSHVTLSPFTQQPVFIPHFTPNIAPRSPSIPGNDSRSNSIDGAWSPHTSSTVDRKPVVVDAKRVLGIDDAAYLHEITSLGRKCSNDLTELEM